MAFNYVDKNPGDLIRSADWNDMGREVTRLGGDKVDLAGNQTITGPLTIKADLGVGTPNLGAQLHIYRKQEDGRDAATHGALVIGNDLATSATLRVGYSQAYSWLQGQGQQNLALNPRGGDVGVGTDAPRSRLSVAGALAVGAAYASGSAAPANSLIVEGNLGIGTPTPQARLHVEGNAWVNGTLGVTGALNFGQTVRQMVNLWGTSYGIGVQTSTTYFRSDGSFAFYRGGIHADAQLTPGTGGTALLSILNSGSVGIGTVTPQARLHVAAGDLRIDGGQEIFFADTGQIRSLDNTHRILFRRPENKLELREYGDIVLSPGATAGNETAKVFFRADGNVGVGTAAPAARLQVAGGAIMPAAGTGEAAGILFPPNPGGGGGDSAWMRYYARTGEATTLELGTANDADDHIALMPSGSVGIRTNNPVRTLHVEGSEVHSGGTGSGFSFGNRESAFVDNPANGERWLWYSSGGTARLWSGGDKLTVTPAGFLGLPGVAAARTALDTGRGVMSGSANDYIKAQFTLSGGGVVTWANGRLKWTNRFIAISANAGTTFSSGYVDINQPTTDIPAANVHNNVARSATADGVQLNGWEALYAVHNPGGGPGEVTYRIVVYTAAFNAPSNWILVGVVNADFNYVKLGTGEIAGRAITPAAGNTDGVGIMWPRDAFGGAGDAAWMRWYTRGGEATTLEIGTSNDGDDHIALMPAGHVGVGVNAPAKRFTVRQPSGGNGFRLEYGSDALNIHWEEGNHNVVFYRDNGIGQWMDINGNWNRNSDLSLKAGVEPMEGALESVMRLRPVRFNWKHNGEADVGLIAQEVEEVFPQLVSRLDNGTCGVAYDAFGVVAIAAVKELVQVVAEQKRRIDELSRRVNPGVANA
ncbi:MAG TPA: tail fiber domain-containing protein [Longimicrobium sp.]|nr:tail fiber domain-containing protein [Longimicrobium sp.]